MFAVVTISDRASIDVSIDISGPLLRSEVESSTSLRCFGSVIVPDDVSQIRNAVQSFCAESKVSLVLTTGGTGLGVRDCTPEAISPILERVAPGIVHLLLSSSLVKTPMAALSRPVAGTIGTTLIVTLPGSTKAVKECVAALVAGGVIGHALDLIAGGSGESVHTGLSSPHRPHVHAHPRLARDPTASVATRQRVSPYPVIPFDEALGIILNTIQPLSSTPCKVGPNLKGHVLAEDVYAPIDIPETDTSNVDGYAVHSIHPPGTYRVLSPASWKDRSSPIPPNHIFRINTGAPLPQGCNAVAMVEDTELVKAEADAHGREEEVEVKILIQVTPQENVRLSGSDVKRGNLVLRRGQVITALGGEVGSLAFLGLREISVQRKPVIGILSTGNELRDLHGNGAAHNDNDAWSGIWDTNRPSLQTSLISLGYDTIDFGIVADDFTGHRDKLKAALAECDLVLTTGGSSMGSTDLLKPVIEDLGGVIHFGRVAVKPGKPTTFASFVQVDGKPSKAIFALPGNPASALVCFNLFVIPALRRFSGYEKRQCQLPRVQVQVAEPMQLDSRPEFHRVVIRRTTEGELVAHSTGGQRSSRIASVSGANGLVALPAWKEGQPRFLNKGARIDAVLVGEMEME